MTLNIDAAASGEATPGTLQPSESPEPVDERAGPARPEADDDRQAIVDAVLRELGSWNPRDRAPAFKQWHRGALSLIHLNVVTVLEAEGPLPMRRLAEALDVSDASATGIVDRMERRGLVERRHATDDRRLVLVHLTEAGAGIFSEAERRRGEFFRRLLDGLTADELETVLAAVKTLLAARRRLLEAAASASGTSGEGHGPGCHSPVERSAGPPPVRTP